MSFDISLAGELSNKQDWYAVYTKSRHEKVAEINLKNRGVTTFLPLREVVSRWKDRNKTINLPLFPSYVFVKIGPMDMHNVMYTKGVLKVVGCNGTPVPVPAEQVEAVRSLIQSRLKYDPYPYLDAGREVLIKSGPLQGIIGKILEKRSKHRFVLSIDLIKKSVSVEIDIVDMEPL
ncbi:MAG: transcription termination/antitermination protein NusG [Ignavibacteriales bacterium]